MKCHRGVLLPAELQLQDNEPYANHLRNLITRLLDDPPDNVKELLASGYKFFSINDIRDGFRYACWFRSEWKEYKLVYIKKESIE